MYLISQKQNLTHPPQNATTETPAWHGGRQLQEAGLSGVDEPADGNAAWVSLEARGMFWNRFYG